MNSLNFFLILTIFPIFSSQLKKSPQRFAPVKIIEEPIQYLNSLYTANHNQPKSDDEIDLKPKFKPAEFSGPSFLAELKGQCFDYLSNNYKWFVCPYQNVTQFEQNLRWEPFKGIIGVWYEWEIIDEKFHSLLMLNGDECGINGPRQAKIFFICNQNDTKTQVDEITEPHVCKYEIKIKTHLVCEKNYDLFTMNVYAYLNDTLKLKWDNIYSQYQNKFITEKMYNISLKQIYQDGEFLRRPEDIKNLEIKQINATNVEPGSNFSNSIKKVKFLTYDELQNKLEECEKENKRLKNILTANNFTEN
ncbi:N-acetylglucosamine-1-phosphotransferase subunit gamma precursor [Brachionus plicatilis]|uniref:N-acetylglucosamine-1-phosphotransferase subunit gamma n=1 Tax=Brachionus plicatilis TaxID=10195 RepID=A0A3M7QQ92_BRAPC|nr:N-acetylglucosamine-1-phosphotransferase subunit gamma precursor [Brachionus plicatilis]